MPKALRWMASAGLCLAVAACSKDDITPEPAPQQSITPTRIIFNVSRGGYEATWFISGGTMTTLKIKPSIPTGSGLSI